MQSDDNNDLNDVDSNELIDKISDFDEMPVDDGIGITIEAEDDEDLDGMVNDDM